MAIKKVYIAGTGPFEYDDTDLVNDPDGDFPGQTHEALTTDGNTAVDGDVVGDMNVTGVYKVDGTQVVNNQQAAIANSAVGSWANVDSKINEILRNLYKIKILKEY